MVKPVLLLRRSSVLFRQEVRQTEPGRDVLTDAEIT